MLCSKAHNQITTYDQRLLVGQSNLLARLDSGNRGMKSRIAHKSIYNDIDLATTNNLTDSVATRIDLDGIRSQSISQSLIFGGVGDNDTIDIKLDSLLGQQLPIGAGYQ